MNPTNQHFSYKSAFSLYEFYDGIDGIPGQPMGLPRNCQSSSSTSSSCSSSSLDLMTLAQPIWNIRCAKDEIFVDAFSFKLDEDPRQCRAGFLKLLALLKIPPDFHFELDGKTYEPDDSYDDDPNRPMLFDLLPLLEFYRNVVREGGNVRRLDVLINWTIQRYLPDEKISFAVFDPPYKEIDRKVIGLAQLMKIYGFTTAMAGCFEDYCNFPASSTIYVPLGWELSKDFLLPKASGMERFQEEIQNIERCLNEIIEFWMDTQDPRLLDELASYVTIAENELLPLCPPYLESALRHQVIFAKEILFQGRGDPCSTETELKLSPESDRHQRRAEKEKLE